MWWRKGAERSHAPAFCVRASPLLVSIGNARSASQQRASETERASRTCGGAWQPSGRKAAAGNECGGRRHKRKHGDGADAGESQHGICTRPAPLATAPCVLLCVADTTSRGKLPALFVFPGGPSFQLFDLCGWCCRNRPSCSRCVPPTPGRPACSSTPAPARGAPYLWRLCLRRPPRTPARLPAPLPVSREPSRA